MNSCIYEGKVRHTRYRPVRHEFRFPLFQMYVDLGELDEIFRGRWLWSTRVFSLAWFRRRDHLGDPGIPLDTAVRNLVHTETGARPDGPIRLLTHLRYLGYCMNPVSFYYCFSSDGSCVEFFALFLDDTMNYSAGIFERPGDSMKDASIAKMDRICRKLDLGPEDHLLEIGTGWGGFAVHAASRYGCRVTTTTISGEQHALGESRVVQAGLESRVDVLMKDYRDLEGQFDKIVSIEMIEAVGHRYLDTYFRQCRQLLKPNGLLLIQAIVTPEYRYEDSRKSVDFIRRHVFPGSCLTSLGQMSASMGRVTDFRTTHVEDIGPHYAETLRRWRRKFRTNLGRARELGYDERFLRMWDYYLCYCEAGFEERIIGDVQMLVERPGSRRPPVLPSLNAFTDSRRTA